MMDRMEKDRLSRFLAMISQTRRRHFLHSRSQRKWPYVALDESLLKRLGTVAKEIECQMSGQSNHCAIYDADLQRICPQLLEIGIPPIPYQCQSRIATSRCQKTVGHADLHFHNTFGSWARRRSQIKPLVEKRKPQPTVRPEYRSPPGAPNCCKKLFGKVVPAKQRHTQSERMKDYWRRRQAARRFPSCR